MIVEWRYDSNLDRDWLIVLSQPDYPLDEATVVETCELDPERTKSRLILSILLREPSKLEGVTNCLDWTEAGDYFRNGYHAQRARCYGEMVVAVDTAGNLLPDMDSELLGQRLEAWQGLDLGHTGNVVLDQVWQGQQDQYLRWFGELRQSLKIGGKAGKGAS